MAAKIIYLQRRARTRESGAVQQGSAQAELRRARIRIAQLEACLAGALQQEPESGTACPDASERHG